MNDAKLLMAFSKRCIGLSDGDKLAIASGVSRPFSTRITASVD
jgi:hypothetical protein